MKRRTPTGELTGPGAGTMRALWCAFVLVLCLNNSSHGADAVRKDAPWAALSDSVFSHLDLLKGTSPSAMVQDDDGFFWLATETGLARWDGNRLQYHKASPSDPEGLPDNSITALYKDRHGTIWVGTFGGGLAHLDPRTGKIRALPVGSAGWRIYTVIGDGAGGLWIGTTGGLDHLDADGITLHRHAEAEAQDGLPSTAAVALALDGAGTLWAGGSGGLYRRPAGAAEFERVALPAVDSRKDESPKVTCLMVERSGKVWIGTLAHGAFVVETGQLKARPVAGVIDSATDSDRTAGGAAGHVNSMVETTAGEVWIGTMHGIVVEDSNAGFKRLIKRQDLSTTSLRDDDIGNLFVDRSGLVWIKTFSGLSYIDPAQHAVNTWASGPHGRANVPEGGSGLLALPNGNVWMGIQGGGVAIFDPLRGRIGELPMDANHPESTLPAGTVRALALVGGRMVYMATKHGLYCVGIDGQELHRVQIEGRDVDAASSTLDVRGNRLWMGGRDGVWRLDLLSDGRIGAVVHLHAKLPEGVHISALSVDVDGHLWVGTNSGLRLWDERADALVPILSDERGRVGITKGYITCLLADSVHRLWVASFGGGVTALKTGGSDVGALAVRLDTNNGLPDNNVASMVEDKRGDVWAGTDNGVGRIGSTDYRVIRLSSADGLGIHAYWDQAVAQTQSGELIFGGQGGLTIIRPDAFHPETVAAPLVLTEIKVGSRANGASVGIDTNQKQLVLSTEQRDLLVEFAALDYAAPASNKYAYRLVGLESNWIAADSSRRVAQYTNLSPGDYTLEIRGSDHNGSWKSTRSLPVHVEPRWYETNWMRALAFLVLLLGLGILSMVPSRVLRQRKRMLERLVAERTAELKLSQERLEQMAYADPLTGLPNRRAFNDQFKRCLALASRGQAFALLLVDLDKFKDVNDTHGHDAGDLLLVTMASRLRETVRDGDCVARLGGDEFAILLADAANPEAVEIACQRISRQLSAPIDYDGAAVFPTASIGVAVALPGARDADSLYKRADMALYSAKSAGRNGWKLAGQEQGA